MRASWHVSVGYGAGDEAYPSTIVMICSLTQRKTTVLLNLHFASECLMHLQCNDNGDRQLDTDLCNNSRCSSTASPFADSHQRYTRVHCPVITGYDRMVSMREMMPGPGGWREEARATIQRERLQVLVLRRITTEALLHIDQSSTYEQGRDRVLSDHCQRHRSLNCAPHANHEYKRPCQQHLAGTAPASGLRGLVRLGATLHRSADARCYWRSTLQSLKVSVDTTDIRWAVALDVLNH